jgi:hypothetical protein
VFLGRGGGINPPPPPTPKPKNCINSQKIYINLHTVTIFFQFSTFFLHVQQERACRRFSMYPVIGFLTEKEGAAMKSVVSLHGKYWLPTHWSFDLVKQARKSGNISSDRAAELILEVWIE